MSGPPDVLRFGVTCLTVLLALLTSTPSHKRPNVPHPPMLGLCRCLVVCFWEQPVLPLASTLPCNNSCRPFVARGKSALASGRKPSVTGPARRVSVVSSTEEEEEGGGAKGAKGASKVEGDIVRRYDIYLVPGTREVSSHFKAPVLLD